MSHNHSHIHSHSNTNVHSLNKSFIFGIVLNCLFVLIEFFAGIYYDSVGLLSDAGHNLGDVASLMLAMLAFKLNTVAPNKNYTYGYKKSTILVSLINAIILFVTIGFIVFESIQKINTYKPVEGSVIIWVAAIGVVINALTALFFIRDKDKDLNIKGAYLHMLTDALISVGVVVSGILIVITQLYIIDVIVGLVVAVVIAVSSYNLLRDSFRLVLDGVPVGIDCKNIVNIIKQEEHVVDVHHLHLWSMSTTENALTVHIVIDDINFLESVKLKIKKDLKNAGIGHSTLEFETIDASKTCENDELIC